MRVVPLEKVDRRPAAARVEEKILEVHAPPRVVGPQFEPHRPRRQL